MTSKRLFGREIRTYVEEVLPSGEPAVGRGQEILSTGGVALRQAFRAKREISPTNPNQATVTIFGLNDTSRGVIDGCAGGTFILEAGYPNTRGVVLKGRVERAWSEKKPAGWETHIEASEGLKERQKRFAKSYGPKAKVSDIFKDIAGTMGNLGKGAYETFKTKGGAAALEEIANGLTLQGKAGDMLTELLAPRGLELMVAEDEVFVMEKGQPLPGDAIVLNRASGLIEAPSRFHDQQRPGRMLVKAKSLLQPGLIPGRRVRIESEGIEGDFKVLVVESSGDNYGSEFYSEITAEAIAA